VRDFFMNGGSRAVIVRLFEATDPTELAAAVTGAGVVSAAATAAVPAAANGAAVTTAALAAVAGAGPAGTAAHDAAAAVAAAAKAKTASLPAIERIDLARLDAEHPGGQAGRRNLFGFGVAPQEERPVAVVAATPPPTPPPSSAATADGAPPTPTLPPLNVKYVGSVENSHGVKVAVLVTDRREVLTGQAGQVVANRYRIARIGLESVDLEDVSNGQSRRVPLRGD
jgi:hypothetical protein